MGLVEQLQNGRRYMQLAAMQLWLFAINLIKRLYNI